MLIGTTAGLQPVVHAGNPDNFWDNHLRFKYTLKDGLPDFDQMRLGLSQALQFPGDSHCGPAAGTNMSVFAAENGFPELLPDQVGLDWEAAGNYGAGTLLVKSLAAPMKCGCVNDPSTGGTRPQGFSDGLVFKLATRKVTVRSHFPVGLFAPTLNNLAVTGLNNNAMSIMYSRYKVVDFTGPPFPGFRKVAFNGAHFVTIRKIERDGAKCMVWVRDPADELKPPIPPNPPPDVKSQEPFKDRLHWADDGWVFVVAGPVLGWRYATRLNDQFFPPYPGINGEFILIDAVITARPSESRVIGANGKLKRIVGGPSWLKGVEGGLAGDGLACEEVPTDFTVLDGDTDPDGRGLIVIAQDEAAAPGPVVGNVRLIDFATDELEILADIPGASDLAVGRNRAAYVVAGSALHRIPVPLVFATDVPEEGQEQMAASIMLPHPADSLVYDDDDDAVAILNVADRKLMRVDQSLAGPVTTLDLPREVAVAPDARLAIRRSDSSLWITSSASTSVYRLTPTKGLMGGGLMAEAIELPGVLSPTSIDFPDDANIVVSDGGALIEFEPIGDAWVALPGSEFSSLDCDAPIIIIEDDRSNGDPVLHDGPEWFEMPPTELPPAFAEQPDPGCQGDLDGDGIVGAADLGILLSLWGSDGFGQLSDFNGDQVIDGQDLGILLAAWGPCP
jgi:hypothetical protein